jgi:hypothetical protein
MNYSIAIIGCGNLGKRYLESLNQIDLKLNIFIVDPNDSNLNSVKQTVENQKAFFIHSYIFYKELISLPNYINLVIVATPSKGRLDILDYLIKNILFNNIILEKILFDNLLHYSLAFKIESKFKSKIFVNCPRRLYDSYKNLKSNIINENIIDISIEGHNWNFSSNLIHFIDLSYFLIDRKVTTEDNSTIKFDKNFIASKHKGFFELFGEFKILVNSVPISIKCNNLDNFPSNFIISIKTNKKIYKIDEKKQTICIINLEDSTINESIFNVEYQSFLGNKLIKKLLLHNHCDLVSLDESLRQHKLFVNDFSNYFFMKGFEFNLCPIT